MTELSELEVRKAVKERYSKLASSKSDCCGGGGSDCCGDSNISRGCCSDASSLITIGEQIPAEASSINAGCGSPLQLVNPKQGEIVLDLGSGGGIDVFRASQLVGSSGRAIGIDATPEMIWRARETAAKYEDKYKNTEFRLGEIEHLPIEANSVDYVISNCVINLSPDKQQVLNESFRVLKPNGVFAVADITVESEIPEITRKDMDSWSACMTGALSDSEYKRLLVSSGFEDVQIEHVSTTSEQLNTGNAKPYQFNFFSSHIRAMKPSHRFR